MVSAEFFFINSIQTGMVVAEAVDDGMVSYNGLRFPASDIPHQVRELYLKNPYRYIPDTSYAPVKLVPVINPKTNSFTDLAFCTSRAVPGVHLEYLSNMEVKSSMSVPVIVDQKLWGLITCHNREPKYISLQERMFFHVSSQFISSQMNSFRKEEKVRSKAWESEIKLKYGELFNSASSLREVFLSEVPDIMKIFDLTGMALNINGNLEVKGQTPDKQQIGSLLDWLRISETPDVFYSDNLTSYNEDAAKYMDKASGLISLPIIPEKGFFLLGFREEVKKTVKWGGNPGEAVTFDSNGSNYHPRKSFDAWQQKVQYTSKPWSETEINMAKFITAAIKKFKM